MAKRGGDAGLTRNLDAKKVSLDEVTLDGLNKNGINTIDDLIRKYDLKDGHPEFGVILDRDGNIVDIIPGHYDEVQLTDYYNALERDKGNISPISVHTHPNNSPPSPDDIKNLFNRNNEGAMVITPDNVYYVLPNKDLSYWDKVDLHNTDGLGKRISDINNPRNLNNKTNPDYVDKFNSEWGDKGVNARIHPILNLIEHQYKNDNTRAKYEKPVSNYFDTTMSNLQNDRIHDDYKKAFDDYGVDYGRANRDDFNFGNVFNDNTISSPEEFIEKWYKWG